MPRLNPFRSIILRLRDQTRPSPSWGAAGDQVEVEVRDVVQEGEDCLDLVRELQLVSAIVHEARACRTLYPGPWSKDTLDSHKARSKPRTETMGDEGKTCTIRVKHQLRRLPMDTRTTIFSVEVTPLMTGRLWPMVKANGDLHSATTLTTMTSTTRKL